MAELTIKNLLEAGVHFGHQTRRWNPKMKKFIFTERNGIYIIDLKKTHELIMKACDAIREITARGGSVLFVGTKPQASTIVRQEAERCAQHYVANRWLGGMLTNYRTIRQSIKRLEHLEKMSTDGTYELLTKKEILTTEKQKLKLLGMLGGIREMNRLPGLLVVVDTKREYIAVKEANRLGIPVCAILDTNCDPEPIDYPIPGNDDAIRSIKVILTAITDSIIEGLHMREEDETAAVSEIHREESKEILVADTGGDIDDGHDAGKEKSKPLRVVKTEPERQDTREKRPRRPQRRPERADAGMSTAEKGKQVGSTRIPAGKETARKKSTPVVKKLGIEEVVEKAPDDAGHDKTGDVSE